MTLDWSTLPYEIAYVSAVVERYRDLGTEGLIVKWLDSASEEELQELAEAAYLMRRDYELIDDWCESNKASHKAESFRVSWMFMIFDHAGLLSDDAEDDE